MISNEQMLIFCWMAICFVWICLNVLETHSLNSNSKFRIFSYNHYFKNYIDLIIFRKAFEKLLEIYLKRFFVHVTCRKKKLSHHSFNATLHFNNLRTALCSKEYVVKIHRFFHVTEIPLFVQLVYETLKSFSLYVPTKKNILYYIYTHFPTIIFPNRINKRYMY